jgi:CPA2 family monovalent cation:H+ antiporter-2
VEFNLSSLLGSPSAIWLVVILVGLSYLVKMVPTLALRALFPWRETLAAGVLLSSRLSLIIAAAAIALQLGVITDAVNSAVILLAVVTTTLSPIAFGRLCRQQAGSRRQGVILVGSDQMTEFLAHRLSEYGETVTLLCPDATHLHALEEIGVKVVTGEIRDEALLERIGAREARALIDLTHTAQDTMDLCRLAKQGFGVPIVISLIGDVDLVPQLQAMGVKVVQPALATAMALEGALRYPTVFDVLVHESPDVEVGEVLLGNASLVNLRVREIRLPGNALIVSLERDDTIMVPHGDTLLRMGDRIDLIGSPEAVYQAAELLRG